VGRTRSSTRSTPTGSRVQKTCAAFELVEELGGPAGWCLALP
jgi:hypothetical protein